VTKVAVGLAREGGAEEAAAEAARRAAAQLAGAPADLAFLFLSPDLADDAADAAAAVMAELGPVRLVGCAAEGLVAGQRELEQGPAAAVWAASLPGADVTPFHASAVSEDDEVVVAGFPMVDEPSLVVLLVDPFTFPADDFLGELNELAPGTPVVGGVAVGGSHSGTLVLDGAVHHDGAVGAVLSGVDVHTVVSQGCRPIGRAAVITRSEGNVVYELAGEPALERLREDLSELAPEERRLAAGGLMAGLVIDENRPDYGRGDFLVRGLLGADEESGAIAIGEQVRVGQTLQFHVRDEASADEDLREALAALPQGAAGALLFTCNGRGTRMFSAPDHDARTLAGSLGNDALAGFFCGGEIGPVGGRVFLHAFTATIAVFLGGQTAGRPGA
jgi:small ligand-binding sensory domain FIST